MAEEKSVSEENNQSSEDAVRVLCTREKAKRSDIISLKSIRPSSPTIVEKEETIYVAEPVKGNYVEKTVVVMEGSDSEEDITVEEQIQEKKTEEKGAQIETSKKDMFNQEWRNSGFYLT
ncbi:Hypothetical predicted protein [Mytilus galloprovincialis]|uniref:Uncharacterized protein n=1 Tax=Mytilus galloprovincialis TaxID=29158 RepID=A0A8B6E5F7_MYTGA|nr:Hypothetical predicted protein [Mytilus galloprovincialis]